MLRVFYLFLISILFANSAYADDLFSIIAPKPQIRVAKNFYGPSCERGEKDCLYPFHYYVVKKELKFREPKTRTIITLHPGERIKVSAIQTQPDGSQMIGFRTKYGDSCVYGSCQIGVPKGSLSLVDPKKTRNIGKPLVPAVDIGKTVNDFFAGIKIAGDPNSKVCADCEKKKKEQAEKNKYEALDKSMAWLGNFLKCDNEKFLKTQRENLIRAEETFKVPAPILACLIGRESRWDIGADQPIYKDGRIVKYGSFYGLPQANDDTFKTVKAYIDDDNKLIYNDARRDRWNQYTGNMPIGVLQKSSVYRKGKLTADDANKVGVVSIAFTAMYLKQIINRTHSKIEEDKALGKNAAHRFIASEHMQYIAAAAGYNAGPGHVDEILPKSAYYRDDDSWIPQINAPPYEAIEVANQNESCTPKEVAKADTRRKKYKKLKAKDIVCTPEWKSARLQMKRAQAQHKRTEVEQYIKWISVCAKGDQNVLPPQPGLATTEKFFSGSCNAPPPKDKTPAKKAATVVKGKKAAK